MLARITPSPLKGTVPAIASKSMAHRLIICAALANGETHGIGRCSIDRTPLSTFHELIAEGLGQKGDASAC